MSELRLLLENLEAQYRREWFQFWISSTAIVVSAGAFGFEALWAPLQINRGLVGAALSCCCAGLLCWYRAPRRIRSIPQLLDTEYKLKERVQSFVAATSDGAISQARILERQIAEKIDVTRSNSSIQKRSRLLELLISLILLMFTALLLRQHAQPKLNPPLPTAFTKELEDLGAKMAEQMQDLSEKLRQLAQALKKNQLSADEVSKIAKEMQRELSQTAAGESEKRKVTEVLQKLEQQMQEQRRREESQQEQQKSRSGEQDSSAASAGMPQQETERSKSAPPQADQPQSKQNGAAQPNSGGAAQNSGTAQDKNQGTNSAQGKQGSQQGEKSSSQQNGEQGSQSGGTQGKGASSGEKAGAAGQAGESGKESSSQKSGGDGQSEGEAGDAGGEGAAGGSSAGSSSEGEGEGEGGAGKGASGKGSGQQPGQDGSSPGEGEGSGEGAGSGGASGQEQGSSKSGSGDKKSTAGDAAGAGQGSQQASQREQGQGAGEKAPGTDKSGAATSGDASGKGADQGATDSGAQDGNESTGTSAGAQGTAATPPVADTPSQKEKTDLAGSQSGSGERGNINAPQGSDGDGRLAGTSSESIRDQVSFQEQQVELQGEKPDERFAQGEQKAGDKRMNTDEPEESIPAQVVAEVPRVPVLQDEQSQQLPLEYERQIYRKR